MVFVKIFASNIEKRCSHNRLAQSLVSVYRFVCAALQYLMRIETFTKF